MRLAALALATVVAACGSSVPGPSPPPSVLPAPTTTAPIPLPSAGPAPDAGPSLDALAARGPSVAAGMRETVRGEVASAGAAVERPVVQATAVDTCVRVTLAAQPAVHAWLADARGDRLADVTDVTSALLAPLGPVCVRKGDTVTLHLEAPAPFDARFVAWASP